MCPSMFRLVNNQKRTFEKKKMKVRKTTGFKEATKIKLMKKYDEQGASQHSILRRISTQEKVKYFITNSCYGFQA